MPHAAPAVDEITVPQEPAERAALESSVSSSLADIFKDGDEELVDSSPARKEPPKEESEPSAETEPEPAPAEAAASEPEKAEPSPTPTATPAAAALPAAYRRSLKAYQWTDEEIDGALKANAEGFLKTAERIHANRVQESQRWADMGRKARETETAATAPAPKPKVDYTALRKQYGNEPFIDAMEAQAAQLEAAQAFITQSQTRQQAQELETLQKSVDGFFTSGELAPYADTYGKSGRNLTPEQLAARQKVLEHADLLISGARTMGRPLSLDEAMTNAHDAVSSPIAAKAAVKKVQQQVTARQASITQRPGSRAAAPQAATRSDLEKNVKGKLAAIFK